MAVAAFNMWKATLEEKLPSILKSSHWHELVAVIHCRVVLKSIGGLFQAMILMHRLIIVVSAH